MCLNTPFIMANGKLVDPNMVNGGQFPEEIPEGAVLAATFFDPASGGLVCSTLVSDRDKFLSRRRKNYRPGQDSDPRAGFLHIFTVEVGQFGGLCTSRTIPLGEYLRLYGGHLRVRAKKTDDWRLVDALTKRAPTDFRQPVPTLA